MKKFLQNNKSALVAFAIWLIGVGGLAGLDQYNQAQINNYKREQRQEIVQKRRKQEQKEEKQDQKRLENNKKLWSKLG